MEESFDKNNYKYNPNFHKFAEFLGLNKFSRENYELAKKVSFIYDWAKEQVGRDDPDTIMRAVNNLQHNLGTTTVGKPLIDLLHKQIRLDSTSPKPKFTKHKPVRAKPDIVTESIEKAMRPVERRIRKEIKERIKNTVTASIEESNANN